MKTYINGNCIEQILTNAVELTQAEYNALPTEQKNHGTYIITDSDSPSIPATDVKYSSDVSVKDKIDELSASITVNTFNLNVEVTANTTVTTNIDWSDIDRSKVLYSWVWWSNPTNDTPTAITTYYNSTGVGALNQIVHKWSVAQTVKFKICYIYKA